MSSPIDTVIARLDQIVIESYQNASRIGYFASLYRRVTITIKSKLGTGYFENDDRLERLDQTFAGRYFSAYDAWRSGSNNLLKSWKVAFDATQSTKPTVLAHLLAGINPHMNVDLGVACAVIAPGDEISSLQGDFNRINDLLKTLVPEVRDELTQESQRLKLLTAVIGHVENLILDVGIFAARESSWLFATRLAKEDAAAQQSAIQERDDEMAPLGEKLVEPTIISRVLDFVSSDDSDETIRSIIKILNEDLPPLELNAS